MPAPLVRIVAALTVFAGTAASAAAGPDYTVDILSRDFYPHLRDSWMFQINDGGVAAGYTIPVGSGSRPTLYAGNGAFAGVPGLPPFVAGSLTGVSNTGAVLGSVRDANFNFTDFVVRNGVVQAFPVGFVPAGITPNGTVYGSAFLDGFDVAVFTTAGGVPTLLPIAAPGYAAFFPFDRDGLNDAGRIALYADTDDFSRTDFFLFDVPTGVLSELRMPDGFSNPSGVQVLADGRVFGLLSSADFSRQRYGFWTPRGTFAGFFDPPAGVSGVRFNDVGQAIGLRDGTPYLYDGSGWTPRTLPDLNGYALSSIDDFNNRGQFVGLALQPDGRFLWAFVASPAVPEPGTLGLFAAGGLGLLAARRRHPTRLPEGGDPPARDPVT